MSTLFLPSLLPPPSWWQNKHCLLYVTGHRPKNKLLFSINGSGGFLLAAGGPGCKNAGLCRVARYFFVAYGQHLNKKCPKLQNRSTMIIYIITEDSKCLKSSVFLLKKSGFANEARFGP